jgi:hypothetical protein
LSGVALATVSRYGLTSLPAAVASPDRLQELVRSQRLIQNSLHFRRDMTLCEDHSQLCMAHAPQVLSTLTTLVVRLVARLGKTNVAEARRVFAHQLERLSLLRLPEEHCLGGEQLCNSPECYSLPLDIASRSLYTLY